MKKWRLIIDIEKCENCNNCFLACKDEHCGNDWPGYAMSQPIHGQRWMNILRKERGVFPIIDVAYLPSPCMHCDNPPCLHAAKNSAVVQRPDGVVLLDPVKAVGQMHLVKACPYGAIWWNAEKNLPQKCTLCAHLLDDGWPTPRCVQACPTGALSIIKLEDIQLQALVETRQLATLGGPNNPTRPNVFYKNLFRFKKCFIAGSVAGKIKGRTECIAGAMVRLAHKDQTLNQVPTDTYGDFKFDHLDAYSGIYHIEIHHQETLKKKIEIELEESMSIGTIWV